MSNIKKIVQNDAEWLKWRFEGLGASDAPIYLESNGLNFSKYKTKEILLKEKINRKSLEDNKNNFITRLGHEAEEKARAITECFLSFEYFKEITLNSLCAESSEHPFLRASLDGYSPELNLAWECKLVGRKKYLWIKDDKKCPDDFFIQTQHQMLVTNVDKILLTAVWLKFEDKKPRIDYNHIASIVIKRDDNFINNTLFPQAKSFWNDVLKGRNE